MAPIAITLVGMPPISLLRLVPGDDEPSEVLVTPAVCAVQGGSGGTRARQ
ncbi:hypothetical protein GCM10009760_09630 [Kitasatospora kazusensis]|uniref:Uncharacterized protein n=1 Tax=Kitasatospora kazusensis TaxID=407974 RepID=A0ABN2YWB0_9ACTN